MKDTYRGIILCVAIVLASVLSGDQVAAFGEGSWSDSVLSGLGVRTVQVAPYVRVGYQRMSYNLNAPIPPTGSGNWSMDDMDVKLEKQEFLIGTLGVNTLVRQRFGFFAEASVSAERAGSVTTFFSNPVVPIVPTTPTGWSWPTSGVRWWEINLAGSANFTDAGGLLLGIKFDRLTQKLTGVSNAFFWPGLLAQDHIGDLDIQTVSPYIGFRFDDWYARIDLIWSPFLMYYKAKMPLVMTYMQPGTAGDRTNTYDLSGGGGNLLEAYGEGKFNLSHLAAKLWLKASWMNCKGNANRDWQGHFGTIDYGELSQSAPGSLSRYFWALGLAGEITF